MTDRERTLARIRALGVVPIIRAAGADEARRVIEAIREGGLDVVEITMTVPGALRIIEEVAAKADGVTLGAGTVLDPETARACLFAGASFIVSPALHLPTVELCRRQGAVVMPGALTPTEVVAAWQAGADLVKIFPVSAVGGPAYLKALAGPLPQIELVPTGGVDLKNAGDFIRAGAAAVGVGADLTRGKRAEITEKTRRLLEAVSEARAT